MKRGLLIFTASVCALTISACATAPQQVVTAPQAVQERRPAPEPIKAPTPVVQAVPQSQPPQIMTAPAGPMPGSIDDFIASAGDRIFFGYNQYDLTPKAREVLRAQASWLGSYSDAIAVIGGNADERGTREYNLALGARRAESVKDFLVSQGVNPLRLTTVSYGKERPISGDSDESSWSLNRNSHTAIISGVTG